MVVVEGVMKKIGRQTDLTKSLACAALGWLVWRVFKE